MENNIISIPDSYINKQTFLEIQKCNDETLHYGLKLSEEDIKIILETRKESLIKTGRVEFSGGLIQKIILAFCDSPYISQYNYIETIDDIIEAFYYYKNETMDEIGDDELINLMKNYFDNECQGSLDLLKYKYLDNIAHNIKYGVADYFNMDEDEDK
ncbi:MULTISPECIES: DUF6323 family protein [Clostridium]|uniref:DUF6323 family protein n=1 Tax=Clostridium TaxID=1485 RepID=UPI00189B2426|nr:MULTISPECIES: DUF6323 family protein [Clostridium]MCR1951118.1 DUF6323 family protein [Clostridium sp. DSM 100503]MDI9218257.1 DUF6323 family protein [Clostridium tertium]